MSFMHAPAFEPLDLDAIRAANPLPAVAGAVIQLKRAGKEWKACCPFHGERTPSFTIFADGNRFHCFGCGASGDVLDLVQALHGVGFRDAAKMLGADTLPRVSLPALPTAKDDKPERVADALAIWRAASPVECTLAETYLRSRAITCDLPISLRYSELAYGRRGKVYPCLIACISSPEGPLQGIQRTYLSTDGLGKADVPAPRLSLGKLAGGAVRLGPVAPELVLAEGLEDALSLQQELGKTAWATCGTSNLAKVQFTPEVRRVAIGGDNDAPGRKAAQSAADAHVERGLEVRVFFPTHAKDFNQELREAAQ